jgi:hypothetical protein
MGEDNVMLQPENFSKADLSFKFRQLELKSMVYVRFILSICIGYAIHIPESVIFKFCQLSKTQWMSEEVEMHVRSKVFQDTNSILPESQGLQQVSIYQVYTWYIICIYHAEVMFEPS